MPSTAATLCTGFGRAGSTGWSGSKVDALGWQCKVEEQKPAGLDAGFGRVGRVEEVREADVHALRGGGLALALLLHVPEDAGVWAYELLLAQAAHG